MNTVKITAPRNNVKLIAHRGLSGLEQENTCAAFVAAGNRGAYFGIETDVHRTADGQYIIIHDDSTLRVTGQEYTVEETDFQTLRNLQVLDRDGEMHRADLCLPSLEEYIRICKRYEKVAVLELKNPMPEQDICNIINTVQQLDYTKQLIVISFYPENLIFLRKHFPDQAAQFLLGKWDERCMDYLLQYHLDLDLHCEAVTEELVKKLHAAGVEVNCWTVDDPEMAATLIGWGVDYITTNILE